MTDRRRTGGAPLEDAVRRAVESLGATAVVVRELDLPVAEQERLAARLRALLARDVPVLLARDPAAARRAGVDGVHLAATGPTEAEARRVLGPAAILGRSTHAAAESVAAERAGADYVMFGPVLATPKPWGDAGPVGFEAASRAAAAVAIPTVFVGGLGPEDLGRARAAGAAGVAAIRAFMSP